MSTTSISALPAGIQKLYENGLLPSTLSIGKIANASTSQINKLVGSTIAGQQASTLLGITNTSVDTASLSSNATNALLQQLSTPSTTSDTVNNPASADPLTAAVNNALTSTLDAAVSKFLPTTKPATGTHINEVG